MSVQLLYKSDNAYDTRKCGLTTGIFRSLFIGLIYCIVTACSDGYVFAITPLIDVKVVGVMRQR